MSILNMPDALVSRWAFQGDARDGMGRYDGVAADMAGWPASFLKNGLTCAEFDGDDSVITLGDITQLNAVSAFTLCFWMAQDALDQDDIIFSKDYGTAASKIAIETDAANGYLYFRPRGTTNYGWVDYSTIMSAAHWYHVAMVFEGTQAVAANRLLAYLNGNPITLTYAGTVAAATADLAGDDAYWGYASTAFDGRLFDGRLYNRALSRDQINQIIHEPAALV